MTVVFVRALRDLRRSIISWGIGVALAVAFMVSFWPSVESMPNFEEFAASYPEVMQELFNITEFTQPSGYLNAELFSFFIPLLFAGFAIAKGARLLAGQEEEGTLEVLLTMPLPRWQVLAGKAAALGVAVTVLGAVLLATLVVATPLAGMDLALGELAASSSSMVLFGLEFGWLAMAVGAATGSRGLAFGASTTAALAAYLLFVMSRLVESLDGWGVLSPVEHALRDGPLGTGWQVGYLFAMLAAGLAALLLVTSRFTHRDLRT